MELDVVGICEEKWNEEQDFCSGNCRIYNTLKDVTGVGRVIIVRIKTKPTPEITMQVYISTFLAVDEA